MQRFAGLAVALAIAGGLALLNLLQRLHFDFGLLFWPCGFKARTGYPCITCGMTRSVLAFSRGDLGEAFALQPAAAFLGLLVVAAGGVGLFIAVTGRLPHWVRQGFAEFRLKRFLLVLILILLAGWAVTLAQAYGIEY
jgi:hypothetical protein